MEPLPRERSAIAKSVQNHPVKTVEFKNTTLASHRELFLCLTINRSISISYLNFYKHDINSNSTSKLNELKVYNKSSNQIITIYNLNILKI